ncbi:hypothetical protein DEA8626_00638 [Defluviimonas aquaemixtae]|uniref:Uncharacterized protein n=1 Tax=Albidovulum aquaemixtae TaxID=1542388 RepID=A0A2R8B3R0_9RHOB|nr:hypothetical protein [Defluviimonas aquaemixtae]SPH17123.1 hypothetical protein DEA8626_00638 [Defluviimonas aquaemixtae]
MSGLDVQQMARRVAELMEARLHVRGADLSQKLRRGARFLPRKVRKSAAYLARAAEDAQVPRLHMRLDQAEIAKAYDTCVRYLKPLGAGARRKAILLDILTGLAGGIFVACLFVLALLVWRGFL